MLAATMTAVTADPARANDPPKDQYAANSFIPPELPEALLADMSSRRSCVMSEPDPAALLGPGVGEPGLGQLVGEQKRRNAHILEQRLKLDAAAVEQNASHQKERLRHEVGLQAQKFMDQLGELLRQEEASLDLQVENQRRSLEERYAREKLAFDTKASGAFLAHEAKKLEQKKAETPMPIRLEVPSLLEFAAREGRRGKAAAALQRLPALDLADAETAEIPTRIAEAKAHGVDATAVAEAERLYQEKVVRNFQAQRAHERLLGAALTGRSDMPENLPLSAAASWRPLHGSWAPSRTVVRTTTTIRTTPRAPTRTELRRIYVRKLGDPLKQSYNTSYSASGSSTEAEEEDREQGRRAGFPGAPRATVPFTPSDSLPSTAPASSPEPSEHGDDDELLEEEGNFQDGQEAQTAQATSFVLRDAETVPLSSLLGNILAWGDSGCAPERSRADWADDEHYRRPPSSAADPEGQDAPSKSITVLNLPEAETL